MTGALHLVRTDDAKKHFYNSAFMFTPQGMNKVPYNKHSSCRLANTCRTPRKSACSRSSVSSSRTSSVFDISDFEPGDSLSTFVSNGKRFGVLICFETVYPEFVRDLVNSGADFLTSITNDDWFGPTSGPYQHAVIPVFRAVENRIWIVRAANTGISEIINPNGRIIAKTKLGETTFLSGMIGDRLPTTPFRVYGAVALEDLSCRCRCWLRYFCCSRKGIMTSAHVDHHSPDTAWLCSDLQAQLYQWQTYTNKDEITSLNYFAGEVWATTTGGLVRFAPSLDTIKPTSKSDGLGSIQLNFTTYAGDSIAYIGSSDGVLSKLDLQDGSFHQLHLPRS